jgi:hypothetical protein
MTKESKTFKASVKLNPEKGGGWLGLVEIINNLTMVSSNYEVSAWKNASAAKKWVKTQLQTKTPRKSVKLNITATNEAGKPVSFTGELTYKE